jgi:hypothetical protein
MKRLFRKESGEIDMVSLILTVVIAGITLMVGIIILANIESSIGTTSSLVSYTATKYGNGTWAAEWRTVPFGQSVLSTAFGNVMTNSGTAFNFLALGLFVLAAVFIIGIVAGVLGKSD